MEVEHTLIMLNHICVLGTGLLEGQAVDETVEETRSKFIPTYIVCISFFAYYF